MNIRLFDSTGNYAHDLPFFETDNLHTVTKKDADFIIAKALEINPKLFEQGVQVGVSPNNNTVYFYKHAPKAINAFENKDMIFATCVQVCNTDGQINRVCAIYCTPDEFENKTLPLAIEGFEVAKVGDYQNCKPTDLINAVGRQKLKMLDGIEKQDLSLALGLEHIFQCESKDERANEKNDWLIRLQSLGCLKEERGNGNMLHLVPTTKPQYMYKAYQMIQDITKSNPNIRNIKYDVKECKITFEAYEKNQRFPEGKWRPLRMNVLNDHLEYHGMLIDTKSAVDKKALQDMLNDPNLPEVFGDYMGTQGFFTEGFYYHCLETDRLDSYWKNIDMRSGRIEVHDGALVRLNDTEWAEKQARLKEQSTETSEPAKPQKKSWFGKK